MILSAASRRVEHRGAACFPFVESSRSRACFATSQRVRNLFETTDFSRSWTRITGVNRGEDLCCAIPDPEPVYVIKEDLKNPNLLFSGAEFSAYASVDGGQSWHRIINNMPTVTVHDLLIHPRDGDFIAGTHGRGIWILDDIIPSSSSPTR